MPQYLYSVRTTARLNLAFCRVLVKGDAVALVIRRPSSGVVVDTVGASLVPVVDEKKGFYGK